MKNKLIFFAAIFLLSGVCACLYIAYDFGQTMKQFDKGVSAEFIPPSVPKKQTEDFARHFKKMDAATETKFLPDTSFLDLKGKSVRLSGFHGKPVLVNFWATWCLPCVVELPSLQKFAKLYDGRINVVGIALEEGKDVQDIASFLEKRGVGSFAGYLDKDGSFARNLGLRGIPTSFLLGSNGQILYRFEGEAEWSLPDSTEFFDVFLLQNP